LQKRGGKVFERGENFNSGHRRCRSWEEGGKGPILLLRNRAAPARKKKVLDWGGEKGEASFISERRSLGLEGRREAIPSMKKGGERENSLFRKGFAMPT